MDLTYEFLQKNKAKVELREDLCMGHCDDYPEEVYSKLLSFINDEEEIIIPKGSVVEVQVQPFNYFFEFTLENGTKLDVAFDDDEELNNYVSFINNIGPNEYFTKTKEA